MKSASPLGSSLGSSFAALLGSPGFSSTGTVAVGEFGASGEFVLGKRAIAGDGSGAGWTLLGAGVFGLCVWRLQQHDCRRRRLDAAARRLERGRRACRQVSARGRCARRATAAVGRPPRPDARAPGANAASAASRVSNSGYTIRWRQGAPIVKKRIGSVHPLASAPGGAIAQPVYCAAPASGGLGRVLPLMSVAG